VAEAGPRRNLLPRKHSLRVTSAVATIRYEKGFLDTNADASIKWIDSAVGKVWKERHDCNWRPDGPTVTLENCVKQGDQAKKKARSSLTSSGSHKRSKSPSVSCACLHCQQVMLTEMCGAQCASPIYPLRTVQASYGFVLSIQPRR
jgi:hypothetical protein